MNDGLETEKSRQALVSLAREAAERVDGEALARGLATVRARLEQKRARRFPLSRAWLAGAAILVSVLLVFGIERHYAPPLSYRVDGAAVERAGYVSGRAAVHFSDGSELKLDGRARASIASVDPEGAKVELEDGVMRADIVHNARTRWLFEAGPFSIHVRGTSFSVDWSGAEGRLEVLLYSGLLEIQTPFSQGSVALHSGQRLLATLRDRQVIVSTIEETGAEPTLDSVAPPVPSAQPAPSAESEPPSLVARAVPSASEPRPTWASRMASGNWQAILDEALQQGVDATLAKRSSDELALLSAAARYGNRPDVARRALVAQRARFAGSTHAKDAAFLLGRIDEGADAQSALGWYGRYLVEAPSGAYAAEATGRKMLTLRRVHGDEQARSVAESYLKRWPKGPHADAARALLGHP